LPSEEHFDEDGTVGGAFLQDVYDPHDKEIRVSVEGLHERCIRTPIGTHPGKSWHSWRHLDKQLLCPVPPIIRTPARTVGENAVKTRIGFRVEV
jgi:hypothetical protein